MRDGSVARYLQSVSHYHGRSNRLIFTVICEALRASNPKEPRFVCIAVSSNRTET